MPRRVSPPMHPVRRGLRLLGRCLLITIGLAVIVVALHGAAEPYRQFLAFREGLTCAPGARDCAGNETGVITGRRTWTTSSTTFDADGHTRTTSHTHYGITWQRGDGSQESREVSQGLYSEAREGRSAKLWIWRGEVVGIAVNDAEEWFLPEPGRKLRLWLCLALLGLGILLWGLLFGRVKDAFFRLVVWLSFGFALVNVSTDVLAFGLAAFQPALGGVAGLVVVVVLGLVLSGLFWFLAGTRSSLRSRPRFDTSRVRHRIRRTRVAAVFGRGRRGNRP